MASQLTLFANASDTFPDVTAALALGLHGGVEPPTKLTSDARGEDTG